MNRHRFHSLCPYFAMFPESFAEKWIGDLTRKNDLVLDPFAGRGTTPFCAISLGRRSISCDTNKVAFCLTFSKTNAPQRSSLLARLREVERGFHKRTWLPRASATSEFFQYAYSPSTLAQLLYLRGALDWRNRRTDAMIASLALGSLHGEVSDAKSYFSNQMPRTISTKPAYSVRYWQERGLEAPERDVFEVLGRKARYRYESEPPSGTSMVLNTDMRFLPRIASEHCRKVRAVITSPPYFDTTNFAEDQWLRLWFLGGGETPQGGSRSSDDRHGDPSKYWSFIGDMWRSLGQLVAKGGSVVVRIGSPKLSPTQIADGLVGTSIFSGRRVKLCSAEVTKLKRRQTDNFRPGTMGCGVEIDFHFEVQN